MTGTLANLQPFVRYLLEVYNDVRDDGEPIPAFSMGPRDQFVTPAAVDPTSILTHLRNIHNQLRNHPTMPRPPGLQNLINYVGRAVAFWDARIQADQASAATPAGPVPTFANP